MDVDSSEKEVRLVDLDLKKGIQLVCCRGQRSDSNGRLVGSPDLVLDDNDDELVKLGGSGRVVERCSCVEPESYDNYLNAREVIPGWGCAGVYCDR